jgi:hypothetical protein
MSNPGTFGDLGKEARDALLRSKEFVNKPHVDVVTTSSNGVKTTGKITREDAGALSGSVELKFPKTNGVESSVNLDTTNKVKLAASVSDKIAAGLKASLNAEVDAVRNEKLIKAGFEYKRPYLTSAATFSFPLKREIKDPEADGPSVLASVVVGHDRYGVAGGLEADVAVNTSSVKSHNVTLLYRNGSFVSTAFSKAKGGKKPSFVCGGTFFSRFNGSALANAEAAAEVAYDTKAEKDQVTVTLGGAFDVNKDSRLAATFDTRGRLVAQLSHRLNGNTRFKLGLEASPLTDQAPKFFSGLNFTD